MCEQYDIVFLTSHVLCLQVTFEQHKENLSRMFRQYQHQESTGTIRSISGVSQSSETMECVNGPPAEETTPSTVIELTVDKLSQKSPDSASSSTITSSPLEADDERGHASITVSNILAGAKDEEQEQQQLVEESTRDCSGVREETQKGATEQASEDVNKEKAQTSTGKTAQHETADTKAVDEGKVSAPSGSDDAQTPVTDDEKSESEQNKGDSSNSMTEDSLNEAEAEPPAASERENSVLGGASVLNEDLVDVSSVSDQVHPSDADDSQEESSYASAATGEEGGEVKKDEDEQKDGGEELELNKEEEKVETQESEVKQAPCVESQTPPAEIPEKSVTEAPKEKAGDEQSSSIAETTTTSQQPSDTTPPSTVQEVTAASDSTADVQPSETSGATGEETPSSAADSSTTTTSTSSDTQKGAESVSKTKEIKIARLDVSNVALDTERLELKETSATVCNPPLFLALMCYSVVTIVYYSLGVTRS